MGVCCRQRSHIHLQSHILGAIPVDEETYSVKDGRRSDSLVRRHILGIGGSGYGGQTNAV